MDEPDGMDATAEGSPIMLAEKRTMSFPDRKIVLGSTPVHEETSHVLRAYARSDARIYEVPCPECGTMSELLCPPQTGPFEAEVFRYVFLAGRGAESDESIVVHGRAESVHHQAGRGRHAGG